MYRITAPLRWSEGIIARYRENEQGNPALSLTENPRTGYNFLINPYGKDGDRMSNEYEKARIAFSEISENEDASVLLDE